MPAFFENGVFTDNKPAWHGAGIVLPEDVVSIERVFELVPELASEVVQVPLYVGAHETGPLGAGPVYPLKKMPNHFGNVRVLDGAPLGVVGSRYRILQNRDAFGFVQDLVDTGGAIIKTAGTLRGGATVWFLCKLPEDVVIGGVDTERLETYILISNSHDGSSAVTVAIVTVRVVCSNTLAAALSGAPRTFKMRHTASLDGKLTEARQALDVSFRYQRELAEIAEGLAETSFSDDEFRAFLQDLVPDRVQKDGTKAKQPIRIRQQIASVYALTEDLDKIRGTKWGALQAVTAWTDHRATYKRSNTASREENRFERIVGGQSLGSKGFELLTAAAK